MAKRGFLKYKTYVFIDKDPIIDYLRTAKSDAEMNNSQLAIASGVSSTTLHSWFNGKTRRPQFATVAAAAGAMGLTELPLTAKGRKT